jgi:hypothetical protein
VERRYESIGITAKVCGAVDAGKTGRRGFHVGDVGPKYVPTQDKFRPFSCDRIAFILFSFQAVVRLQFRISGCYLDRKSIPSIQAFPGADEMR